MAFRNCLVIKDKAMKAQGQEILEGNISKGLIRLAIPIMATSFLEMAYNLTDMFWIGNLSSKEVAAVGTAGYFPWLMMGLVTIPRIGAEALIARSIGQKNEENRRGYIAAVLQMSIVMGLLYSFFVYLNSGWLLNIFQIRETDVVQMAGQYLKIIVFGLIFAFLNPVFTGTFNAHGQSKLPFYFNTAGLVVNMILDPILIFGWLGLPKMGVEGAALATVIAQMTVSVCFVIFMLRNKDEFSQIPILQIRWNRWRRVFLIGAPAAVQGVLFTLISVALARIITVWGAAAIAVQKVTAQIEAISWRSAQGFGTALTAYVGQNYGAQKNERVKASYCSAVSKGTAIGVLSTVLLALFPHILLAPFFYEPEVLEMGIHCMRIMSVCQMFMSAEIITAGGFNGLGRTLPPSIVGIVFTGMRIPLAMLLASFMGLDGVWWSMTISSVVKGLILPSWFYFGAYRKLK